MGHGPGATGRCGRPGRVAAAVDVTRQDRWIPVMGTHRMAEAGTGALYRRFVGPLLSRDEGADAEQLSQVSLQLLGQASLRRHWPLLSTTLEGLGSELQRRDLRLQQTLFGCRFLNPVGLAAGFDKNAVAAGLWHLFGFGFAELGTVTWHGQPGNPRPALVPPLNHICRCRRTYASACRGSPAPS